MKNRTGKQLDFLPSQSKVGCWKETLLLPVHTGTLDSSTRKWGRVHCDTNTERTASGWLDIPVAKSLLPLTARAGLRNKHQISTDSTKEYLLQKGRTRCEVHLEQEANRILQHTTDRKLECVPCHIITQKYWQTWPAWSQPKKWCVSKHVSSVAKQVRTKHQQRVRRCGTRNTHCSRYTCPRCFWTCYLGGNTPAIEHITYTWWPNSWQPNSCCFSSTSGGNFQQVTHSGFKEIQNFPTEKPTFHTLAIRLKDEKMTHFSGSKFISSGMELFIVRDFSAWERFMKEICNSHSSEQMGYRVSNILPWC